MSKMRRILIFLALKWKVTKRSKLSLEIHDFDLRAHRNVISEHFQIFATLYKDENYHHIVWHVKYELWRNEGLKIRENKLD
jgi:hypothetical protein